MYKSVGGLQNGRSNGRNKRKARSPFKRAYWNTFRKGRRTYKKERAFSTRAVCLRGESQCGGREKIHPECNSSWAGKGADPGWSFAYGCAHPGRRGAGSWKRRPFRFRKLQADWPMRRGWAFRRGNCRKTPHSSWPGDGGKILRWR